MIDVNDSPPHILQNGLENIFSIHRETLSPMSGRHCDEIPADRIDHSNEKDPRLDEESIEETRTTAML